MKNKSTLYLLVATIIFLALTDLYHAMVIQQQRQEIRELYKAYTGCLHNQ